MTRFFIEDLNKKTGGTKVFLEQIFKHLDDLLDSESGLKVYVQIPDKVETTYKNIQIVKENASSLIKFDVIKMWRNANKLNADVLIGTKYFTPPAPGKKRITFIHDLGYFVNSKYYQWKQRLKIITLLFIGRPFIQSYVAVSNFTKNDIKRYLKIEEKQIIVINHGPGIADMDQVVEVSDLPKDFILYAGNNSRRKNLNRIMEAINQIDPRPYLVITGYKPKSAISVKHKNKLEADNKIMYSGKVSDEQLRYLYSKASLFLYPSLYEGFGLPILEAQYYKVPVITSNLASMPEVAGKGAILVDPYSVDEIKEAIIELTNNKKTRAKLIKLGLENVNRFSWEKSARQLINLCKTI